MFKWIRQQVLFVMRVPHDPEPPFGAPGSPRVFRAGRKYFTLRILGWGFTQLFVLAGLIFWALAKKPEPLEGRAVATFKSASMVLMASSRVWSRLPYACPAGLSP